MATRPTVMPVRHGRRHIGIGPHHGWTRMCPPGPPMGAAGPLWAISDAGRTGRDGTRGDRRLDGEAGPGDTGQARPGSHPGIALQRPPDSRPNRSHSLQWARSHASSAEGTEVAGGGRRARDRHTVQHRPPLARRSAGIDGGPDPAHRRCGRGDTCVPGGWRTSRRPGDHGDRTQRSLRWTPSADRLVLSLSVRPRSVRRDAGHQACEVRRHRQRPRSFAGRDEQSGCARRANYRPGLHGTASRLARTDLPAIHRRRRKPCPILCSMVGDPTRQRGRRGWT